MERSLDQLTRIAREAAQIGSNLIKRTRPQHIAEKSDRDIYTDVDVKIEHEIRFFLAEATPEIGFIGEEEGRGQKSLGSLNWILDPIDGTANFAHDIPLCATQIACINGDTTVVSAINMPYMDLHYWATRGNGAYVNGEKINVSSTTSLPKAVVSIGDYATGHDATAKNKKRINLTSILAERVERIRMFGSAAYDFAWLAEGRIDATIIMSNNLLDIAPGALLAAEAGAEIVDISGSKHSTSSKETICVTPLLKSQLLNCINSAF